VSDPQSAHGKPLERGGRPPLPAGDGTRPTYHASVLALAGCSYGVCDKACVAEIYCRYADMSYQRGSVCAEHLADLFDYLSDLSSVGSWPRTLRFRMIVRPYDKRVHP
jgi:hypothetical protein